MLRRCVWSRNIKNGCSIYIYDISRLRVKNVLSYTSTPPICLNSMHKDIFTFTSSGDYDQAVTNIIVLNVPYSCYFDCLHTSGLGISDEHICDRGEEIAERILAGNVCIPRILAWENCVGRTFCLQYLRRHCIKWLSRNTNKMQLCNRIYYSKVYWRLNMFRAAHRSSSGALNCVCSL